MVLVRTLGWGLLALAVGAIVYDALAWWSDGAFHLLTLHELWARLDLGSLDRTEAGLQSPLSGMLWTGLLQPLLAVPALPAFILLGAFLVWLSRRGGSPGEAGFLQGSRPRRRRSRGLS